MSRRCALIVRQPFGKLRRADEIVSQQAFDAEPHVVEAAGRVDARGECERKIGCDQPRHVAAGHAAKRGDACARAAGADAAQASGDEHAIVRIERHEIGDRAERDEIEQRRKIGLGRSRVTPARAQARAQREQQAEHHANAGDGLARKRIAGKIRIHDRVRVGQRHARKVMIGDDDLHSARARSRDAGMASHAVVDGDDQVRRFCGEIIDEAGRQTIAVREAIRHAIAHVSRAEQTQAAHGDGRAGRTVRVEIADDADRSVAVDRIDENLARALKTAKRRRIGEARQFRIERCVGREPAQRVDASEHRMHGRRPRVRIESTRTAPDRSRLHRKLCPSQDRRTRGAIRADSARR